MLSNPFKRFSRFKSRERLLHKSMKNPYVTDNVVGGGPEFLGRTHILQSMMEQLRCPQQDVIVLYGKRRIGKTSILRELEKRLRDNYQSIYFEGRYALSLKDILSQFVCEIRSELPFLKPNLEDVEFHTWLSQIINIEVNIVRPLVILFDETEALQEKTQYELFNYLHKTLFPTTAHKLKFIFAIGYNDINEFKSLRELSKPISSFQVPHLNRQETEILIRSSERVGLHWSKEAIERVWKLTEGDPRITQHFCAHIFSEVCNTSIDSVSPKIVEQQWDNFSKNSIPKLLTR